MARIAVLHPGYDGLDGVDELLLLPAADGGPLGGSAKYLFVHTAAAIVANNRFDGWLSVDKGEGGVTPPRVEADDSGLIPAGQYYFHVPADPTNTTDTQPYPVVPNFRSWKFPHGKLPPVWDQSIGLYESEPQDQRFSGPQAETCRLTGNRLALEYAHMIPSNEHVWFAANAMRQYRDVTSNSANASLVDQQSNRLNLQRTPHFLWDQGYFSIIPVKDVPASGWCTQMLFWDSELFAQWHGRDLLPIAGRPSEYVFARFAWDVFPKVIPFLSDEKPRRLAVKVNGEDVVDIKMYSPVQCIPFIKDQGRGRSTSPTKRQRTLMEREHDGQSDDGWESDVSDDADLGQGIWEEGSSQPSFDSGVEDVDSQGGHLSKDNARKRPCHSSESPSPPRNIYPFRQLHDEENRGRRLIRRW